MSARRTLRTLILATIASPCLAVAGAAPDPREAPEAVVQVYGARAMGVKGWFAVHTWVAVKPTDATAYTVYEVIGWGLRAQASGPSCTRKSGAAASTSSSSASTRRRATIPTLGSTRCGRARTPTPSPPG